VVDDVADHCRHSHKRSSFMSLFGSSNTFDPMGSCLLVIIIIIIIIIITLTISNVP